jgi:hypothetical protein
MAPPEGSSCTPRERHGGIVNNEIMNIREYSEVSCR